MRIHVSRISCLVMVLSVAAMTGLHAQQPPLTSPALTPVPRVLWFSGVFRPANGLPVAQIESITVTIYRDREGGDAVWHETQNVAMEAGGRYNLLMGSSVADGLPLELFTSGEPRWIGVTVNRAGEVEQPRVHLASVPYALKAADADTLGGLPASAYLLASPRSSSSSSTSTDGASPQASGQSPGGISALTAGTPGYVGMFLDSANLGDSALFQNAGSIGLGTTTPRDKFHAVVNNGSGALTGFAVQNLSGAGGAYSGMLFYDQNGGLGLFQGFNNATHEYRINNVGSGGSINFRIAGSSKFQVANSGNIGIGTTDPPFKLSVLDASNTGLRVQTNAAGGTVASFGGFGDFQIDAAGVQGGRLIAKESGHVGIGTNAPLARLHVGTATDTNPGIISAWDARHVVIGGPNNTGGIGMSYDQTNNVGYIEGLTPNVAFRSLVLQSGGGNVGIGTGTTSPTVKLSVAGTIQSTTGGFKFPDGTVQATATGTTYTSYRDNQIYFPVAQLAVLSLTSLPPGTYLLTASLHMHNNANYAFADNTRHIYCQFSDGTPYVVSIPHFYWETLTLHTIMTISSGSVDLICSRLYSDQDEAWTTHRRITAVKVGNVISQ